jgi:hypothetical protein
MSLSLLSVPRYCSSCGLDFSAPSDEPANINKSPQPTAGRCDDQVEFMKHIVDVAKARFRQR